jgi:hypothetical protein
MLMILKKKMRRWCERFWLNTTVNVAGVIVYSSLMILRLQRILNITFVKNVRNYAVYKLCDSLLYYTREDGYSKEGW